MKKVLLLMFSFVLTACGGGGGDESKAPSQHFAITQSDLSKYVGGEILTYNVSIKGSFDTDGSGRIDESGTLTEYYYDGWLFSELDEEALLKVTEVLTTDFNTTTNDYYFYNADEELRQFVTSNENFFTDPDNPQQGTLILPQFLYLGLAWQNNPEAFYGGKKGLLFTGSRTSTIIKKETVVAPIGSVETYKISSSFMGEKQNSSLLNDNIEINETKWVHPEIGVIKSISNLREWNDAASSLSYTTTISQDLIEINWSID